MGSQKQTSARLLHLDFEGGEGLGFTGRLNAASSVAKRDKSSPLEFLDDLAVNGKFAGEIKSGFTVSDGLDGYINMLAKKQDRRLHW
jgi:hypothetical protein